jgi:hypothetical protein
VADFWNWVDNSHVEGALFFIVLGCALIWFADRAQKRRDRKERGE